MSYFEISNLDPGTPGTTLNINYLRKVFGDSED